MSELRARERISNAYKRAEVDRPPVCPHFIRWVRGNYGCACEMHQFKYLKELGFDPLIMYGAYFNHPISSDYIYSPNEDGGYRDLPGVNVEMRVERGKDKTLHWRKFETPAGTLTDVLEWALPGVGYGDGPNPHRVEPLVKDMEDVASLEHLFPEPRKGFTEDLRMFTEMAGDEGLVEYYESSSGGGWGLECLDPQERLIYVMTNKELLSAVIEVCQKQHLRNLKEVLESGHKHFVVSWFQFGLSVGWSPETVREVFLPFIKESVELVHSYDGVYRFQDDGQMSWIMPELVDMGVDVAGSLQPPPMGDSHVGELKAEYGDRICLFGGLDPVYTFEMGTTSQVREAVEEMCNHAGDGRGYVFSTGEAFGPETKVECLREWVRVVKEWNWR